MGGDCGRVTSTESRSRVPGPLPLASVLIPMVLAPLGSMVVYLVTGILIDGIRLAGWDRFAWVYLTAICGVVALIAEFVVVFPIFVLVPRLRQLPWWMAFAIGAALAFGVGRLLAGRMPWRGIAICVGMGGSSGFIYAMAVGRSP